MVFSNVFYIAVCDKVGTVLGINEVVVFVGKNIGTFVGIDIGICFGRNSG